MRLINIALIGLLMAACSPAVPLVPTSALLPNVESAATLPASSCTAVSSSAERDDFVASLPFGEANEADWQRGPSEAAVTLIEYADFQCPGCAQISPILAELERRYPDDLRVVYRHYPLIGTAEQPLHDKAALSMQAAEAAGLQGKFWELHDELFSRQSEWAGLSPAEFESWLREAALALDLDLEQFTTDLQSEEAAEQAQAAWERGQTLGIPGTPFLIFNGLPYDGRLDAVSLETFFLLERLQVRLFEECPAMTLQPGQGYTATLQTEKGDIVFELFPDVAPIAVNSFIFLAQHDWFDNITFHRVLPGFIAQSGDPSGTGYGGPGYFFAIETDASLTFDRAGLLAMANSGPTSNGSQFFITLGPAEHLNGQYTIFGEVIQGLDVAESLTPRDPSQSADLPAGDLLLDVSVEVH
jgi:cyclophilin family peptidyl-prolyl cis-trans isomerase/protein-disulfide isomerase